jgi:hypothetical protein
MILLQTKTGWLLIPYPLHLNGTPIGVDYFSFSLKAVKLAIAGVLTSIR